MGIINCHTHTFTSRAVPDDFLPWPATPLLRSPVARGVARWVMERRWRGDHDIGDRLSRFVAQVALPSQEAAYNRLLLHYPADAQFVVLPMDFEFAGYRRPSQSTDEQLDELAVLAELAEGRLLPFCPIDPRRPDLLGWVRHWIEDRQFKGLKLYPPLGYQPTDERLRDTLAYAQDHAVPVMSHCGGAAVRQVGLTADEASALAAPNNYAALLDDLPELRICLAHFGGAGEWDRTLQLGRYTDDPGPTWVDDIRRLLKAGYAGLYTDISYTMFCGSDRADYLLLLLLDPDLRDRVLFGTDFFMVHLEDKSEKQVCVELRATLGEELWQQVSCTNPRRYLNLPGNC